MLVLVLESATQVKRQAEGGLTKDEEQQLHQVLAKGSSSTRSSPSD